jgi:predicted amidophosphoribosyltransferase
VTGRCRECYAEIPTFSRNALCPRCHLLFDRYAASDKRVMERLLRKEHKPEIIFHRTA